MDTTSERETLDFMSVESFSQLPFIRSAPPPKGASGIRLFGQEFGTQKNANANANDDDDDDDNNVAEEYSEASKDGAEGGSRKFECHYCCRNFPTSQALGGHQNAHKRERQQAKRAHLQSAMLHGGFGDPHVYGLVNYTRLVSAPPLPAAYHSWSSGVSSSAYSASSRIYGGYGAVSAAQPQPITGSPLAFWRVPAAQGPAAAAFAGRGDRPAPPSAFGKRDERKPLSSSMSSVVAGSQFMYGYDSKAQMQEHVSLDLHL